MERSCKKCSFRKTQPYKTVGIAAETFQGTSRTKETSNHPAWIGTGLRKTGSFQLRGRFLAGLCAKRLFVLSQENLVRSAVASSGVAYPCAEAFLRLFHLAFRRCAYSLDLHDICPNNTLLTKSLIIKHC